MEDLEDALLPVAIGAGSWFDCCAFLKLQRYFFDDLRHSGSPGIGFPV